MRTEFHVIDFGGAQNGIAFRVENAIMVLSWLRTFEGFPRTTKG